MISQQSSPKQENRQIQLTQHQLIQKILTQLNLKSIDQILQSDHINVDFLAKSTNLHKSIVIKLLFQLQQYLLHPEQLVNPQKYCISLKQIVSEWVEKPDSACPSLEKIKDLQVGSADIVEIIGRANCGKSTFSFFFALHCLKKGLTVLIIDSNFNFEKFIEFMKQKLGEKTIEYDNLMKKVINFKFKTMSQFSILMHNLGCCLIEQKNKNSGKSLIQKGVITLIDCLSRIQMADPDSDQQNATMDFDIIDKIKKLITIYSQRVSTVVYTNRIQNTYSMFNTIYKNEKNRPRCRNNNYKIWDSISTKTILVQYSKTMSNHEVKKIHFTKDISNQILTFQR